MPRILKRLQTLKDFFQLLSYSTSLLDEHLESANALCMSKGQGVLKPWTSSRL